MKNKMWIGVLLAMMVGIMLPLSGIAWAGDVVVIANKNAPDSTLSREDLKNIFLAKKSQWNSGGSINFAILTQGATHETFLKQYIQKTPSQFERHFRKLIFTGKGKAPTTMSSEKEMLAYVSSTEGAIGYVSFETNTSAVMVINVQ
ncbi:MAG: hypothetical protein HKP58_01615 [Desulfatitalea sp.]|nr:substrate-binding domain-containing protein [Desulfatitalea sp.]NNJ99085.1 hypothetical protein [Desulfatitalea sp.]